MTTSRRRRIASIGVLVVVLLSVVAGATRLDEALGLLDWTADRNAARGYLDRTFADDGLVIEDRRVIEDARLWMPENATYRIVVGRRMPSVRFGDVAPDFLRYFLLPRRESTDSRYVICLDCEPSDLGGDVEVLSRGRATIFGRSRR
jgi:hypothetical protein